MNSRNEEARTRVRYCCSCGENVVVSRKEEGKDPPEDRPRVEKFFAKHLLQETGVVWIQWDEEDEDA